MLVDSLVPEYGGNRANIAGIEDRVTVNISDVRDPHSLAPLVRGQDVLFNLAGQTSHLDSMTDPFTDLEINCRAQLSILEACRAHNPGVEGRLREHAADLRPAAVPARRRGHPVDPVDVNGINKAAGEAYHLLYGRSTACASCALRLTNTYGPRMRVRDARQTFLGVWLQGGAARRARSSVCGDGSTAARLLYVDDAVRAFLLAAARDEADGQVFNVGGTEPISLVELADLLVASTAAARTARPVPAAAQGDRHRRLLRRRRQDPRRRSAGSRRSALEQGLERTLDYYREHGDAVLGPVSVPSSTSRARVAALRDELDAAIAGSSTRAVRARRARGRVRAGLRRATAARARRSGSRRGRTRSRSRCRPSASSRATR